MLFAGRDTDLAKRESFTINDFANIRIGRQANVRYDELYRAITEFFLKQGVRLQWVYLGGGTSREYLSQMGYNHNIAFCMPEYAISSLVPGHYLNNIEQVPLSQPLFLDSFAVYLKSFESPAILAIMEAFSTLAQAGVNSSGQQE